MATAHDALARVRDDLERAAVFTDFDGTLAPIVEHPDDAALLDGAADVVRQMAERAGLFAVVSGRPISFLEARVPAGPVLSGLYGLELHRAGVHHDHPEAGSWREVVLDVQASSEAAGPEGMFVESKGVSLTFHYRSDPGLASDVKGWAERQAARSGLEVRPAKMSVELHPPVTTDKGSVVRELVGDLEPVVFIGDDHGDLPAFAALHELAAAGRCVVGVAVAGDETDPKILEAAHLVVDGPEGAVGVLRDLLGQDTDRN